MKASELLNAALDYGMIDLAEIREACEMKRRTDILARHPYKITQAKDGQWTTHYYEGGRRKQIKRKLRSDVEDFLVRIYAEEENNPTIDEIFDKVQNDKRIFDHKKESTISRNRRAYVRYFSEFGKRRVKNVTETEIESFIRDTRRTFDLDRKSYIYLTSLLRMVFGEALVMGLVDFDVDVVIKRATLSQKKSFRSVKRDDTEEVYSIEDLTKLEDAIKADGGVHALGIEVLLLTGMRIGEVVALTWDDYDESGRTLHIHRTETTYNDGPHVLIRVDDAPKTDSGDRFIPVTKKLREVLYLLRAMPGESEYILSYRGERIRSEKLRRKLVRLCRVAGIEYKSPHKLRKTFASRLAVLGVPSQVITDLMGHEDYQVTKSHYIKRYADPTEYMVYLESLSL